jgi:signal transduction histidine kinase
MGRIRIAGRLALIVVGAIVFVQMLLAAVYFFDRAHTPERARFTPLLAQIAALVQALDRVPAADRALVVRAASGLRFQASVRADKPAALAHSPILGGAERRLALLIGPPDNRLIALSLDRHREPDGRMRPLRDLIGTRLHAVIALTSGGYLDVESNGELTARLFGIPIGLIAGILGFAVALAALLAVRRETKPLSDLTGAVEGFGPALDPRPIAERGAPDVRALIRAVNAMQARIADLVRSRTLVLGAISHDLRTYVTRLRLRLELLPDSEQRGKAVSDLDGMQALLDDALAYARASFTKDGGEPVDIVRLLRAEVEARNAQGARVTLAGADRPTWVAGPAAGLARVIANLTDNALAYGECADLSLHPTDDGAVELWVEDRGPGIPAAERGNVFEPFYRLEASRSRDTGGTGLGLTIVRQIVESQGGSITIDDRPGGGTRLRLRLKRAEKRIADLQAG